jgi:hypothetical protein
MISRMRARASSVEVLPTPGEGGEDVRQRRAVVDAGLLGPKDQADQDGDRGTDLHGQKAPAPG